MDDEYILLISFDFDGLNRFCNSCRLLFASSSMKNQKKGD